jgi:hypothetical protein
VRPGVRRGAAIPETLILSITVMAMTLRLSEEKERSLERMAESLRMSKNLAAAEAIAMAAPGPSHPDEIADSMRRQLSRYADLMTRLANA